MVIVKVCRAVNTVGLPPWQQTNDFSAVYLYVATWCFGLFIPIFCFYSHISDIFVVGISSMGLNEGGIQISSQMLAKSPG